MEYPSALLYIPVLLAAVFIDVWFIRLWRRKRKNASRQEDSPAGAVQVLGAPSPFLTFLGKIRLLDLAYRRLIALPALHPTIQPGPAEQVVQPAAARSEQKTFAISWGIFFELSAILFWAVWIGRNLLIFSPNLIPNGYEFANLTQTHYLWTYLARCGTCFLWNGSVNGGAPAFAEVSGAILHPFVFLPVLLWGVIDGAKITIIASLALAGTAQWILSARLGLGRFARLWSALIIVTGGHLVGKMENGNIALILGLACANLVLAFGVDRFYNHNRRAMPWLAAAIALLILSGEGYIQIGSALTLFPMLAIFVFLDPGKNKRAAKDYLLALGLAVMIAGVLLVPLLHFLPQMDKDFDPGLRDFPPLETIPLSLVIRDLNYYRTSILGNNPYLYTHMNTIGWVPVLLALAAPGLTPPRLRKLLWTFLAGIGLVFLVTSADLPKLLLNTFPFIARLRHLTVASGLVVPLVVTLAAISLDHLIQSSTLRVSLQNTKETFFSASLGRIVFIPLAVLSLLPLYQISQEFLITRDISWSVKDAQTLKTPSTQWVDPPYGFYDWTTYALSRGMKIANTWRPWFWKYHTNPQPYLRAYPLNGSECNGNPAH